MCVVEPSQKSKLIDKPHGQKQNKNRSPPKPHPLSITAANRTPNANKKKVSNSTGSRTETIGYIAICI